MNRIQAPLLKAPVTFGAKKKAVSVEPSFETASTSAQAGVNTLLIKKPLGQATVHTIQSADQMNLFWGILKGDATPKPDIDFTQQAVVVVGYPVGGGALALSRKAITFDGKNLAITLSEKSGIGTMIPKTAWYLAVVDADKVTGNVTAKVE